MKHQRMLLLDIMKRFQPADKIKRTICMFFSISLILTLIFSSIAQAQMQSIKKGDKVRVYAPTVDEQAVTGTVGSISPSAIAVVTKKSTLIIPNTSINSLSVSRGKKRNIGKGALIGAVSGGIIFGITAAATNPPPEQCDEDSVIFCGAFELSDGQAFTLGAALGVLAGGATGAIIGAVTQTHRWEKVPVRIAMNMTPSYTEPLVFNPTVSMRLSF